MSKSWLWVFVVWFISLLVGVLWGLLSLPGVNATRMGLGKYSATVQAVSPALLVLLVLALVLLTLAYAILTHKLPTRYQFACVHRGVSVQTSRSKSTCLSVR